MKMHEVKITQNQYDYLERIRYDRAKKFNYISKFLHPKYQINENTVFFTYRDAHYRYLVFESEVIESGKIPPSRIIKKENP